MHGLAPSAMIRLVHRLAVDLGLITSTVGRSVMHGRGHRRILASAWAGVAMRSSECPASAGSALWTAPRMDRIAPFPTNPAIDLTVRPRKCSRRFEANSYPASAAVQRRWPRSSRPAGTSSGPCPGAAGWEALARQACWFVREGKREPLLLAAF